MCSQNWLKTFSQREEITRSFAVPVFLTHSAISTNIFWDPDEFRASCYSVHHQHSAECQWMIEKQGTEEQCSEIKPESVILIQHNKAKVRRQCALQSLSWVEQQSGCSWLGLPSLILCLCAAAGEPRTLHVLGSHPMNCIPSFEFFFFCYSPNFIF